MQRKALAALTALPLAVFLLPATAIAHPGGARTAATSGRAPTPATRLVTSSVIWSGWTEVPGGGASTDGPAATTYLGSEYVFARGIDSRVEVNKLTGTGWTGWSPLPGADPTQGRPAAVEYNGLLRLFAQGLNNRIYTRSFDGASWSGWGPLPGNGTTPSAPSATVLDGVLHLIVQGGITKGGDAPIYQNVLNGAVWSGWTEVPGGGTTPDGPATTRYGIALYLFVRAVDGRVYVNTLVGTIWSGWSPLSGNFRTPSPLGATVFQSRLYLFARSDRSRIYENTFDGDVWTDWAEVPGNGETPNAPAANNVLDTALHLLVSGASNRLFIDKLTP